MKALHISDKMQIYSISTARKFLCAFYKECLL